MSMGCTHGDGGGQEGAPAPPAPPLDVPPICADCAAKAGGALQVGYRRWVVLSAGKCGHCQKTALVAGIAAFGLKVVSLAPA